MSPVRTLVEKYGGRAFSSKVNGISKELPIEGALKNELASLLESKNGFFAFESALHVFPFGEVGHGSVHLLGWNSLETWKDAYDVNLANSFCFAENVFGEQFVIVGEYICRFDPETGEFEELATSLDDWAEQVIADPDYAIGYLLGKQWQVTNGPLQIGSRLVPKLPFACGGEFEIANLYSMGAARSMQLRANLANQIANLPDGATIQIDFSE